MNDWRIFDPNSTTKRKNVKRLPPAPPWRRPGETREKVLAATFRPSEDLIDAVNTALYLRRPLLITGKPGSGKSSLIFAVAEQLKLGKVLVWAINSRSTLRDGLYQYDALARLQHIQNLQALAGGKKIKSDEAEEFGLFLSLEALGTALASRKGSRALLIDEIDKSDVDLPNDLLNVLDTGRFPIPELRRAKARVIGIRTQDKEKVMIEGGEVTFSEFPFVVMTSNGERDFPAPFLRRCVQCQLPEPSPDELKNIVAAHFPRLTEKAAGLIGKFVKQRGSVALATDQLLNAVHMVHASGLSFTEQDEDKLLKTLFQGLG